MWPSIDKIAKVRMLGFSDGFLTRRKREGNFFPITRVIEESLESWRLFKIESELGIEEWYWPLQRRIITRKCLKVGGSLSFASESRVNFYSIQLIFFHPPYRDTSARQSCPLLSIIPDPVLACHLEAALQNFPSPSNRRRHCGKRGNGVLVHRGRGKFLFSLRASRGIPTTTTTTATTMPRADETRKCV